MPAKPILVYKLIKRGDSVPIFLQKKISEQRQLLEIIRRIFPEQLTTLIIGCVRKNNELLILSESAALISQLRFHNSTILDAVKSHRITSIKFRVIQPKRNKPQPEHTPVIPSMNTVEALRACGHSISGPKLKRSIERLAETFEKLNTHPPPK